MTIKRFLAISLLASITLCVLGSNSFAGGSNYTVAEIFEKKDSLEGKDVTVKGKVAKFSSAIMGTNWVHLKDGTGSAGTDDLMVTTDDVAAVGDSIVVNGKISRDVDFGYGYKYSVIIQKAKLTK